MAEIILTNSEFKVSIDDCHFDELNKYKWRCNHNGYAEVDRKTKLYTKYKTRKMHRIIYQIINGVGCLKPDNLIDHHDGCTFNNTSINLRLATHQQNNRNIKKRVGKTSKYKGVHWDKWKNRWISNITIDGKAKYLGSCMIETDAARKYNEAVLKYFGDWGLLNVIEE